MSFAIVSLSGQESWLPERLAGAALSWPSKEFSTRPLRDVAVQIKPDTFAASGTTTITPGDIDVHFGGLSRRSRTYSGPAYQVRDTGTGLSPGDLLIAPQARIPVLRVWPRHVGSQVSAAFVAIRPEPGYSLWLWAVLSSQAGTAFRAHLAATSNARTSFRANLFDFELPVPPLEHAEGINPNLKHIEDGTIRDEEEPAASWWRTTELDSGDWQLKVATPDPSIFGDGVPLGDLCRDIAVGSGPRDISAPIVDDQDALPLATVSSLSGRKEAPSVESLQAVIAEPGDVLVAAVGTRAYATPVKSRTAVGKGVMVLRLIDPAHANGISRFLNSVSGRSVRRMLTTSVAIPSISRKGMSSIPVPSDALAESVSPAPARLLAPELERVLWG